jgi:hypothetical protein
VTATEKKEFFSHRGHRGHRELKNMDKKQHIVDEIERTAKENNGTMRLAGEGKNLRWLKEF